MALNSTFDITRQAAWDWWVFVCLAAAGVLLCYAVLAKLWMRGGRGFLSLIFACAGIAGTAAVLVMPALRTPKVGFFWTFAILILVSATFYLELIERLGRRKMAVLLAARIVALALAVPMLFEPVLRYVTHRNPERPLLLLVDKSGSMSFPDVQNGPTRIASVWQTIEPKLDLIRAKFVPRFFTFATGWEELKSPEDLSTAVADGKSTDIALGINQTLRQVKRDDASIVLFSDGIDNSSPDVIEAIRDSHVPVHTLRVGSEQTQAANLINIAVTDVESPDDFVVNHQSMIVVTVQSTALPNRIVEVKMAEVDDKGAPIGPVAREKLILDPSQTAGQKVKLPYKPAAVGVHRVAAWVDPVPGERSVVDNRQEFQGLAIDPRIKVLYIEGRLRPEYRELCRALRADPNVELLAMLRIQKDRFATLGTVDEKPFDRRGIPDSPDDWKKFDVIILGDLDSSFVSRMQQEQIEQFVLNGGALLMLGGQNSLGPGGYANTPIGKALPVSVGPLDSPQEKTEFVPRLTAEGSTHPAMEGLGDFFGVESKPGIKPLPGLRGNVVVGTQKQGAQVLLIHAGRPGPGGLPQTILAVQHYGKGRTAVFTADTTFLWALPLYGMGQDSPHNRLWGQLVRWLAGADVRNRQKGAGVEALLNKTVFSLGDSVRVRALVRDERGAATEFAQVTLKLQKAASKDSPQEMTLNPVEGHTGMYDLVIPHPDRGDWTAELSVAKDGKLLAKEDLKFVVLPPADEMLKLAANPKLLKEIADATHDHARPPHAGTHRDLAGFSQLLDELIREDKTPPDKETSVNLSNSIRAALVFAGREPQWPAEWDLPMQAVLVIALLSIEWILRRRWQLP